MSIFDEQEFTKQSFQSEQAPPAFNQVAHFAELSAGAGSDVFKVNRDGVFIGATNFADAPFSVTYQGDCIANSITIHGRDGQDLADAINGDANLITDVINARFNTATKNILAGFDFGSTDFAGAVKAGDITWNTTTGAVTGGSGVVLNRAGLIGANAGVTTFSIDATTGNAVFAGSLTAATGTLGSLTIASGGNIKFGQTAYDTGTGFWLGDVSGTPKLSVGNSSGNKLLWDGTSLSVYGLIAAKGTGSGVDVKINPSTGAVEFYKDADKIGYISANTSQNVIIDSDNITRIQADGVEIEYNVDNNNTDCEWYSNTNLRMKLDQSGNLSIDGTYSDGGADFAEMFESLSGKKIPVGTVVAIENGKVRPAVEGDKLVGVISEKPAFIGNSGGMKENRKEKENWVVVGLVGRVKILPNQPLDSRWIQLSNNEYIIK